MRPLTRPMILALTLAVGGVSLGAPPNISKEDLVKILRTIDERTRSGGDYKALAYVEQKEKDKTDVAREALVYRREAGQLLMILFTKPKGEAGKGYLRLEKNLWSYDPSVGKWERRTERERIAGTDSRRADWDKSNLAEEYDPTYEGTAKLGTHDVMLVSLKAKEDVDVAFPVAKLWIDNNNNILKRQDFALSGRLMRTIYYPRYQKVFSESKGAEIWYAQEVRIYDEVEKANQTLIVIKGVDLHPLPENLFTKAWLESKSR